MQTALRSRPYQGIALRAKKVLRPAIALGIRQVLRRPVLHAKLSHLLKKFPPLHLRLRRVAVNTGAIRGVDALTLQLAVARRFGGFNPLPEGLPPRARQIYADLKATIERVKD